jgi:hypothetical protein
MGDAMVDSSLNPETVEEAYTIAPAGGNSALPREIPSERTEKLPDSDELTIRNRRSFTYTLSDSKEQIEQAYETFRRARNT